MIWLEMTAEKDGLFEDPNFKADDSALFSDYTTPLSRLTGKVTWLRPKQICKSPCLFPDDFTEAYPKQGILGDCWLLCACNMLLKSRYLLDQVMPPGQCVWGKRGYTGQFWFQFWRNGHWTKVQIDDRLPCINNTLCFSRCHSPMAFWVALLEKAYAKLHGSYERLWAGQVCEAVVDLSGGVAERWSLKKSVNTPGGKSLFPELSEEMRKQSYISCCVHEAPMGASEQGQFHALNVMEWKDVKTSAGAQVQLLQIRNPWGRRCWEGAWTERGSGWTLLDPSCSADLLGHTKEGEFWVDEMEFRQKFDEVTVGYPISEDHCLQSIYTGSLLTHTQQIGGSWVKGHSAGGCRNNSSYSSNPKFWLKVREGGEVLMSLLQHGPWSSLYNSQKRKSVGNTPQHPYYQAIALHVWKVPSEVDCMVISGTVCPVTSCVPHAHSQEISVQCRLPPAGYVILPSTYQPDCSAEYTLTIAQKIPRKAISCQERLGQAVQETSHVCVMGL
ncbi:calpain-10 isoform X5 [Ictalurus furcatus]|uniref:calpain-10 isoform X5 n=1 Tax=Ictalurus furcatus TaxID=66913 RepID=UPI002350DEBD|nr:calpain-10 isoform X5 [Ictalurus furcatus]